MASDSLPIVNSINDLQKSNRQQSQNLRSTISAGLFDVVKSVNRLSTRVEGRAERVEPTQQFIQQGDGEPQILDYLQTFFGFQTQIQAKRIAEMEQDQREAENRLIELDQDRNRLQQEFVQQQGGFAQVFGGMTEIFSEMAKSLRDIQMQANAIRMIVNSQFEFFVRNKRDEYGLEQNKFLISMAEQGVNPMDSMVTAALDQFKQRQEELVKYERQIMSAKKAAMYDAQGNLIQDPVFQRIDDALQRVVMISSQGNDKLDEIYSETRRGNEKVEEGNTADENNQEKNAGVFAGMLAYLKGLKKNSDKRSEDDLDRTGVGGYFDGDPAEPSSWKKWLLPILSALGITYALQQASNASYDPTKTGLKPEQKDLLFEQTAKNDAEEKQLREELAQNPSDIRREQINTRLDEIAEQNKRIKYRWDQYYRGKLINEQKYSGKDDYDPEVQAYFDQIRRGEAPMPDWWQEELDKEAFSKMSAPTSRLSTSGSNLSANEIEMLMRAAPTSGAPKAGAEIDAKSSSQTAQPPIIIKQGDNNSPVTNQQIIDARVTNQTPPSADKTNKPTRLKYGLMGQ